MIRYRALYLLFCLALPAVATADESDARHWIPPERWPMCWLAADLLSERYRGGASVGAGLDRQFTGALALARGFYEAATKTIFIAGGRSSREALERFGAARLQHSAATTAELERIAAACVSHQPRSGTPEFDRLFPWYAEAVRRLDRERIR